MKSKMFILISTINERILNLKNIIDNHNENIIYNVSHQIDEKLGDEIKIFTDSLKKREDVNYSSLANIGVAKNRNNTLHFIEPSAICLILDDDVILCKNAFDIVLKSFDKNPSADFISFKILDLEGNDYKPYPKVKRLHTLRTLTGVGTTEMAFKSDLILKNNISFDENFGPGSEIYPIGEDFIFAMDLYKMKTKMLFLPIPIVKHPEGSTGSMLDQKVIFGRGAMFARVFGWKAFVVDFIFSIKKHSDYGKEITFFSYLTLLINGTIDYFRTSRKSKI